MHKALSRAGIDDVAGITSLAKRRMENLKYKDGTSEKGILTELPNGYQQLIIFF